MYLGIFPILFNNEPLYGGISRLSRYMGSEISHKQLNELLFGNYHLKSTLDLPSHLRQFEKVISAVTDYSAEYLISTHTLFPFYYHFLSPIKREQIFNLMLGETGNTIHTSIGINASRVARSKFPKYCPLCLQENHEEHGEPYWHLTHQIPGNDVCTIHKCFLYEFKPDLKELNSSMYLNANLAFKRFPPVGYDINDLQFHLSKTLEEIMSGKNSFDINRVSYYEELLNTKYYKNSSIDAEKITSDFVSFYGEKSIGKVLTLGKKMRSWVPDLIKRPERYFDPIRHILISQFINSIEKITKENKCIFGQGPWVCYNKVCDGYLRNVVNQIETHIDSKTKRVIGTFTCKCGMIYTRSFLKQNNRIREFIRIKSRGKLWMLRLRKEIKSNKSFREVGKILGTDAKTISQLVQTEYQSPQKKPKYDAAELSNKRSKWKKLLTKCSLPKVKNARSVNPSLYAWLYRNDIDWLMNINQSNSGEYQRQLKIDWEDRDKIISNELTHVYNTLLGHPAKKVTKTLLLKSISKETTIEKNLEKLPRTKQLLFDFTESGKTYHLRRISLAIRKLIDKNQQLTYWRIVRTAGIREQIAKPMKSEINSIIESQISL